MSWPDQGPRPPLPIPASATLIGTCDIRYLARVLISVPANATLGQEEVEKGEQIRQASRELAAELRRQ